MTAGRTPSSQICVLPVVIQGFAEHVCLLADDPIEDFSEEDMAIGSMAAAGRSPNKHPRTGSEEDSVDIAALLDRAADRFSACMDTKVDSMMDRLEKRIDEKIDSKLGLVMDRLSVLEKTSSSTRSGPSSLSDNGGSTGQSSATGVAPAVFAPYLDIKEWCGFRDRNTHGLTEAQAREIITKLRQGIGPDLDSLIARVGAIRVRNTKIKWYVHESESAQPIPFLTTTSGVPVATVEGAELLGITADKLVMACRRGAL